MQFVGLEGIRFIAQMPNMNIILHHRTILRAFNHMETSGAQLEFYDLANLLSGRGAWFGRGDELSRCGCSVGVSCKIQAYSAR